MTDRHPLLITVCSLLESAARHIDIVRPEPLLGLLNARDIQDELTRLARRSAQSRIRVLMHELDPTLIEGSAFIQTLRRMPSKAELRVLEEHPAWRSETLICVDDARGLIVPSRTRRPIHLRTQRETRFRLNRMEALWAAAHPSPDMRILAQ
jgi:hypothetical protein